MERIERCCLSGMGMETVDEDEGSREEDGQEEAGECRYRDSTS